MAAVKEAVLSANIAFSPQGPWIAAGTIAGAVDVSFSTSSKLEVHRELAALSTVCNAGEAGIERSHKQDSPGVSHAVTSSNGLSSSTGSGLVHRMLFR